MHHQLRHRFTTGVAVTGAAVIAAAPLAASPPLRSLSASSALSAQVALTADAAAGLDIGSLLGPWQDLVEHTRMNLHTLLPSLVDAQERLLSALTPPIQAGGPVELFDGLTFLGGPYFMFRNSLAHWTLEGTATGQQSGTFTATGHIPLYLVLTGQLDHDPYNLPAPAEPIPTLANLLASPLSAVPLGLVSPVIAPLVALLNTVEAAGADLTGTDADPLAALQALLGTPAAMLDGLLNGANLNLDALIPLTSSLLPLPAGADLEHLSYDFGGLLSPGHTVHGAGGSMFNAVGMDITGITVGTSNFDLPVTGYGIGPFGALITLEEDLAFMFQYPAGSIPEDLPPLPDALPAADLGGLGDLTV